ncbi:MAG TPA: tetratricopeptide repeat protein, partial [Chitinophagaceae bacterium]|nr:tetratricopeptide repeat protein [Chitinophagaceae bacterium]
MTESIVFKKKSFADILKNNVWCHLGLLILLPLIIYVQSVKFDYTNFDDNGIILDKIAIVKNIKKIDTVFKTDAFWNSTGDFYRPIQNLSFMLDAQVSGEKLWMFHITNLIIHILTCVSLYYFLQFLSLKRYTAFLLSLLFAVHPLFASGVGWIPSRGDILIGLFGLNLFLTFGKYFKTGNLTYLFLHAILFVITIFTKETTVLFPFFFLYYYFFILKEKFSFKKLSPFAIIWAASFVLFFILRRKVTVGSGATVDVLGIIPFFKNNQVIPTIIGKFFIPYNLSTFPLYENISTIIGIIFMIVLGYLTIKYSTEKKWAVLMGLLWFLFFAIPPTIYRLENADTFFNYLEHRTYLPMMGIVLIVGFFLDEHIDSGIYKKYFAWFYVPLIVVFSILAFMHCADYKDHKSVSNRAAKLNNPAGLSFRAGIWIDKGDTTAAMADMNKAIELNPKDANMFFARGRIKAKMNDHIGAEQDFSLAISLNPGLVNAYLARAVEKRFLKKYESAFRDMFTAVKYDSANPKVHTSLGNLFIAVGDYKNAIVGFSKAISLQPTYAEAYNNRAYAKVLSADYKGAIEDGKMALKIMNQKPSYITYNNIGYAYRELNQLDSA